MGEQQARIVEISRIGLLFVVCHTTVIAIIRNPQFSGISTAVFMSIVKLCSQMYEEQRNMIVALFSTSYKQIYTTFFRFQNDF